MTTTRSRPRTPSLRGVRAAMAAAAIALGIATGGDAHALTQIRSPSACSSVPGAGSGPVDWTTPGLAASSNDAYATALVNGNASRYLQCLNYGFSIPAGAAIVGITVDVERKSDRVSNNGSMDAAMRIVKGGTIGTADRATPTIYTRVDFTEAHPVAPDLWGLAWTSADINAASFGAAFAATKPDPLGPDHSITVDFIGVTVDYAPAVISIVRSDANPTAAPIVSWTVTFSHAVTGVDSGDFTLVQAGGLSGAGITSVTGAGTTWTVTASTGIGNGTLGLSLVDDDSIIDGGSTPLGGTGAGNGNFTGESYTLFRIAVSAFNACSDNSSCPGGSRLNTRIANQNFALFLAALKADGTVETGFNGNATVSLLGRINAGGAVGPDNCPTTAVDLTQSLGSLAFTAGKRTQTSIAVTNAYRDLRVKFDCNATNCPPAGVTRCSGDNFAVRPGDLVLSATVTSPLKAGTVALGDTFVLSANSATTTYNGTPQVDTTLLSAVNSGPNIAGSLDGAFGAASGGTASATFAYSEVGYFSIAVAGVHDSGATRFTIVDPAPGDCTDDFNNTYAAADPTSQVGCRFGNLLPSGNIGRFTPDAFVSLSDGVPIPPIPSVTPFCGSGATGFTYEGQPALRLKFTLEARNKAGGRTRNYDSAYPNGDGMVEVLAENNNDNVDLGGRLGHTGAPWPAWSDGLFVVDKSAAFSRSVAADGPFDSVEVGVRVTRPSAVDGDNDGIKVSPQDMAVAGSNGVKLPGTTRVLFGRLWLGSAYGSEKLALQVPLEAQYWNGFGFVTSAADNCTTIASTSVTLSGWNPAGFSASLTQASVSLSAAFSSGRANLKLLAPGARGSALVCVDLDPGAVPDGSCVAADPANQAYLQAKRVSSPNYDKDPAATVGFGVYKGPESLIYQRENY